jgi:hypothetical protein
MARTLCLRWLAALAGCLFMGCLFHRPGDLPPPELPALEEPSEPMVSSQAAESSDWEPLFDYGLWPAKPIGGERKAASVEPMLERVKLEFGAAPTPDPQPSLPAPVAEAKPPVPEDLLVAALRCAREKHPEEAQRLVQKLDREDRDLLFALIRLTAGIGEKELQKMSAEQLAGSLEQLHQILEQLRQRAPLTLDKVCFCQKIDGFGQYEPLTPPHKFQAGSDGQPGERVQVYVEVRNFSSVARQGQYETRLSSSLEILDEQGQNVVTMMPEPSTDLSQTPRQDYFLNFQFHVPAKLAQGWYRLWVTVRDATPATAGEKKAVRVARRSLDFRVCPPGGRK